MLGINMDHKVGIIRRIYWDLGIGMKVMIVFDPRMTIGVINDHKYKGCDHAASTRQAHAGPSVLNCRFLAVFGAHK